MKITAITTNQTQSKKQPTFLAGWKINGNKILKANDTYTNFIAEHFHKSDSKTLAEISMVKNFFGFLKAKDSIVALKKIKTAVDNVNFIKNALLKDIEALQQKKETTGLSEDELIKLVNAKIQVNNLDIKADNCYGMFYDFDNYDSVGSDPIDDPVTLRNTHYD